MHIKYKGESDEWYTPKYIFTALGDPLFDLDVAAPKDISKLHIRSKNFIHKNSLEMVWNGFCWCNPPYSGRNSKGLWLEKLAKHGTGIALVPDRTSTDWWQDAAQKCDCLLMVKGKIKFEKPDGTTGDQPSNGTTLFGYGTEAINALFLAELNGLGVVLR